MDPYRSTGLELSATPTLLRPASKTAMAARLAGWAAAATALCVLGPPGAAFVAVYVAAIGAPLSEGILGRRRRQRALKALSLLPFDLRHDPGNMAAPIPTVRRVARLMIVLETALPDATMEQVVLGAQLACPALVATTGPATDRLDQVIVLTRWPNESDDIWRLANMLRTWGTELHARHGIRQARVEWLPSGPPPPSMF